MSKRWYKGTFVFHAEEGFDVASLEQAVDQALQTVLACCDDGTQIVDETCKGCNDAWAYRHDGYCPACGEVNQQMQTEAAERMRDA